MKNLLIASVLVLSSTVAQAAPNWVEISNAPNVHWFADADSLKEVTANMRKVWTKGVYADGKSPDGVKVKQEFFLVYFDCAGKMVSYKAYVFFDKAGQIIKSGPLETAFKDITPGTHEDIFHAAVCAVEFSSPTPANSKSL